MNRTLRIFSITIIKRKSDFGENLTSGNEKFKSLGH